jgi:hypothetical protein
MTVHQMASRLQAAIRRNVDGKVWDGPGGWLRDGSEEMRWADLANAGSGTNIKQIEEVAGNTPLTRGRADVGRLKNCCSEDAPPCRKVIPGCASGDHLVTANTSVPRRRRCLIAAHSIGAVRQLNLFCGPGMLRLVLDDTLLPIWPNSIHENLQQRPTDVTRG